MDAYTSFALWLDIGAMIILDYNYTLWDIRIFGIFDSGPVSGGTYSTANIIYLCKANLGSQVSGASLIEDGSIKCVRL